MNTGKRAIHCSFGLRSTLVLICCLFLSANNIHASNEFEAFQKEMMGDFSDYKSKQDKEFTGFLKMHWVGLNSVKGKPLYEKKKIVEPPKAPPEKKQEPAKKPVIVKIPSQKETAVKKTPQQKPVITRVKKNAINVEFYGNKLAFPYDRSMKKRISGKIDKDSISDQWSVLAKSDYEPMIKQFKAYRKQLKLNDWGYVLVVNRVAEQLYPKHENERSLFSWFILIKSGFKSRIAYKERKIFLLLATRQQIYSAQSLKFKNTKYYLVDFDGGKQPKLGRVYTYNGDYPDSKHLFDMRIQQAMVTGFDEAKRSLAFSFSQKKYTINTTSNKYIIDFMKSYPQVHWDTYFNSPVNSTSRQQVADQLRPHLNGLSEQEAVNFLLRFVQTSFAYATDDKQFGYENPLFPEESLFYPASDCEDRSFLFAWLVQDLLGLEVIGLHYPGHIATAVKLNMKVNGDSVRFKGKEYIVADPTFINANVGRAMPKFRNAKVEFIEISKI